jgi:phosphoenolpyruvate-protein phosphotransferase (PTS system enzyme I)
VKIRKGIPVVDGVVIGEAFILDAELYRVTQRFLKVRTPEAVTAELKRFGEAAEKAKKETQELKDKLSGEVSHDVASILDYIALLFEDPDFLSYVEKRVTKDYFTAEHAVSRKVSTYRREWEKHEVTRARLADLDDFERQLLKHLLGEQQAKLDDLRRPVVVLARDLTPSQAASLPLEWVRGFATDTGGKTSHTAILAQSRRIPAVVGLGGITRETVGGEMVILDGRDGKVIIDPDPQTLAKYQDRQQRFERYLRELDELRSLPAETRDGHLVRIYANIEFPEEIAEALRYGAEGIGLYRTEFLYDKDNPDPPEDAHYAAYSRAVDLLGDRPLVIRTLDLGADKFVPDGLEHEKNPFLGCRSIRYCLLERRDVFWRQLRAILRASARGDVRIMLPMISSLEELLDAKSTIDDVKAELRREGVPFREKIPVGIMIEVPSAALMADVLAQYADFFSIGTNDLVQYTLAVDRVNAKVASLYQPSHPAVFRLLLQTIEAARKHKIPVSICGELSGDPHFTLPLVGLGMRDLSMASATIPKIKRFIRSISGLEAGHAVDAVMSIRNATEALEYLHKRAQAIDPALYGL